MDKIRKDKNNNILIFFEFHFYFLIKKGLLFIFDFYKKPLFILTFTCGHFPVVQKSLFIFDFWL